MDVKLKGLRRKISKITECSTGHPVPFNGTTMTVTNSIPCHIMKYMLMKEGPLIKYLLNENIRSEKSRHIYKSEDNLALQEDQEPGGREKVQG